MDFPICYKRGFQFIFFPLYLFRFFANWQNVSHMWKINKWRKLSLNRFGVLALAYGAIVEVFLWKAAHKAPCACRPSNCDYFCAFLFLQCANSNPAGIQLDSIADLQGLLIIKNQKIWKIFHESKRFRTETNFNLLEKMNFS